MAEKPDWNAIRIDYISGTVGQRKLAEKYGIPYSTLRDRAKAEGWAKNREKARSDIVAKAVQRKAALASDNAVIAERIRKKLLERLEKEIDNLPTDSIGSQSRMSQITREVDKKNKNNSKTRDQTREYRIKDLTAAWKDLTDGFDDNGDKDNVVKVVIDV